MEKNLLPYIPDSAPFTPEQRAYLNGFFAGLFSQAAVDGPAATIAAPAAKPLQPLTILFGSQTGNAEGLARRAAKQAGKHGFAPGVFDMAQYARDNLKCEKSLLIITSTYGDGEPPDNAKAFWEFLSSAQAPKLSAVKFSVLALGDSNYPRFCECGKMFDRQLESLGARRVHPRVDCGVDYEEPFVKWLNGVLKALLERGDSRPLSLPGELSPAVARRVVPIQSADKSAHSISGRLDGYSSEAPFLAPLLTNRKLNGEGSTKDTRHFEIALEGSGLSYEVGDGLGVRPTNCPALVEEVLNALGCCGEEAVPGSDGQSVPLREALLRYYEITRIPRPFLEAVAERSGDAALEKLTALGVNGDLTRFLWGREIIDLLLGYPRAKFSPTGFVSLLRRLQPRLYSISSSPKVHSGQLHLTVAVVRYESQGRRRKGVCSTFLAERVHDGAPVPIFVQSNKNFRPPADGGRPMIMVGPGTGVAPFRGFLEERRAIGAKGKNWLLFGEQRVATDFLYHEELEAMLRDGTLTRLDTAFSRDQAEKIYVQHRMLENAIELYAWLEEGAHFYVCGDAKRMAKDVDAVLHQAIQTAGGKTAEQAAEYVKRLQSERRYQRDVY